MYSLAITLNPDLVAQIVAYAAAVGLLWPTVQALLQKPWWSPKAKSIITVVAAVVFGGAGYFVTSGFDFSNPSAIVVWLIGLYGAINLGYQALKRPVLDSLETKGNGAKDGSMNDVEDDDQVEFDDDLPEDPYQGVHVTGDDDEIVRQ